jgi:hypothetical protein
VPVRFEMDRDVSVASISEKPIFILDLYWTTTHLFQPSHRICLLGLYSRCQQQSRRSVMGQISMPPAADTWGPDSNLHGFRTLEILVQQRA